MDASEILRGLASSDPEVRHGAAAELTPLLARLVDGIVWRTYWPAVREDVAQEAAARVIAIQCSPRPLEIRSRGETRSYLSRIVVRSAVDVLRDQGYTAPLVELSELPELGELSPGADAGLAGRFRRPENVDRVLALESFHELVVERYVETPCPYGKDREGRVLRQKRGDAERCSAEYRRILELEPRERVAGIFGPMPSGVRRALMSPFRKRHSEFRDGLRACIEAMVARREITEDVAAEFREFVEGMGERAPPARSGVRKKRNRKKRSLA